MSVDVAFNSFFRNRDRNTEVDGWAESLNKKAKDFGR